MCEDESGLWYYRECSSVLVNHYKELSNNCKWFVCLSSTDSHLKQEITETKN